MIGPYKSRHFIARSSDFGAVLIYYCKTPLLTYAFYDLKHKALGILLFGRERSWRNNWIKQGIKKKSWSHCADHSRQRESRIKLGATAVIQSGATAVIQSQPDYYRSSTWLLLIHALISLWILEYCFKFYYVLCRLWFLIEGIRSDQMKPTLYE